MLKDGFLRFCDDPEIACCRAEAELGRLREENTQLRTQLAESQRKRRDGMKDLIIEARALCDYSEKIVNQLHTERLDYELEYMPLIETIQVTSELCDALEKANAEIEWLQKQKETLSKAVECGCGMCLTRRGLSVCPKIVSGELVTITVAPDKEGE